MIIVIKTALTCFISSHKQWCDVLRLYKGVLVVSQAGGDLFPLDSEGLTISDDTSFLDTWEVSRASVYCYSCCSCWCLATIVYRC